AVSDVELEDRENVGSPHPPDGQVPGRQIFSTLAARRGRVSSSGMSPYTRHQILVLLTIVAVAGAGLAVGHWRRLHPDLADRIERLDRVPTSDGESVPSDDAPVAPSRPPRPAKLSAVAQGTEPTSLPPVK